MISNLWKHPKTTVVGLLLGAVQIGTVLMHAGVVANPWLGASVGIATALLGMFAKDPSAGSAAAAGSSGASGVSKLGAWMLIALLVPATVPQMGCTQSQIQETENLVNVVIQAAGNMAAIADPGSAWATAMPAALAGLKTAEANFAAGTGAAVDVSDAMLAVEDVIAEVEPNSKVSELADILTTAIDAALAMLPAPTAAAGANTAMRSAPRLTLAAYSVRPAKAARYNHHNRASIHHRLFRTRAGDFKAEWNKAVAKNKALAKAALK